MKVIKFSASWCGPCKIMSPIFNKIKEMEDFKNIEFIEMDIEDDDVFEFVNDFNIKSVPTIVVTNENNECIRKIIGTVKESDLIQFIKDCING